MVYMQQEQEPELNPWGPSGQIEPLHSYSQYEYKAAIHIFVNTHRLYHE